MKVYVCDTCKKSLLVLKDSCCTPMCCGKPMRELVANTTDAALEKHVPVVNVTGSKVNVVVGSVEHPMTEAHLIEFIALETSKGVKVNYLTASDKPTANFTLEEGEKPVAVYEYCNLHGLWKKEL